MTNLMATGCEQLYPARIPLRSIILAVFKVSIETLKKVSRTSYLRGVRSSLPLHSIQCELDLRNKYCNREECNLSRARRLPCPYPRGTQVPLSHLRVNLRA